MARRFFTADFHLGMEILLDKSVMGNAVRPFKSIEEMNQAFLDECNKKAKAYIRKVPVLNSDGKPVCTFECQVDENQNILVDRKTLKPMEKTIVVDRDTIVHIGDLACFKSDRSYNGLDVRPQEFIQQVDATFLNIRGNHDVNNKVKNICNCMQTSLGKSFPNVTIGHYPSYDIHAKDTFKEGWIHLCGHVHKAWKHALDLTHSVLNINCGVDVWNYQLVSEDELVRYIKHILRLPKEKINKVQVIGNKVVKVK